MEYFSFNDLSEGLKKLNAEKVEFLDSLAEAFRNVKAPIPNNMLPIVAACDGNEMSVSLGYANVLTDGKMETMKRIVVGSEFQNNALEMALTGTDLEYATNWKEKQYWIFRNLTPETMARDLEWCLTEVARFEERHALKTKSMFSDEPHLTNFLVKAVGDGLDKKKTDALINQPIYLYDDDFTDETVGKVVNIKLQKSGDLIAKAEVPQQLWNPTLMLKENEGVAKLYVMKWKNCYANASE